MAYTSIKANVFGPALLPQAWTDIDMSGAIGSAKRVLGFLHSKASGAMSFLSTTNFRPNDDGDPADDWLNDYDSTGDHGTTQCVPDHASYSWLTACMSDASAVIQQRSRFAAGAGVNATHDLYGYLDVTYSGVNVFSGVVGAAWTTLDISVVVGSNVAFAWLKVRKTAVAGSVVFRATGGGTTVGGGCVYTEADPGKDEAALVVTDANGQLEKYSSSALVEADITVECYTTEVIRCDIVIFGPAAPPVAYANIDLSATVGAMVTLCMFKITTAAGVGADRYDFKPADDADNWDRGDNELAGCGAVIYSAGGTDTYTVAPTDATGIVKWKSVSGTHVTTVTLVAYATNAPTPSGLRNLSTGGMPLGLTGPYPLSGSMRAAGVLWHDEYVSGYLSSIIGAAFTGGPVVDRGLVLDGISQFAKYVSPAPQQSFASDVQYWQIVFTPTFEADDGLEHVIFDCEDVDEDGLTIYGVRKLTTDELRITVVDADIDIALVAYQADWIVGQKNELIVDVDAAGNTVTILNGTQIDSTATAEDVQGVANVYVGVDNDEASGFFAGTVHRLLFGLGSITSGDLPWE
jgi:hypothetical protein